MKFCRYCPASPFPLSEDLLNLLPRLLLAPFLIHYRFDNEITALIWTISSYQSILTECRNLPDPSLASGLEAK